MITESYNSEAGSIWKVKLIEKTYLFYLHGRWDSTNLALDHYPADCKSQAENEREQKGHVV